MMNLAHDVTRQAYGIVAKIVDFDRHRGPIDYLSYEEQNDWKPRLECASPRKDMCKRRKGFGEYHVQCVTHLVHDQEKSHDSVFQPLVFIGTF